MTDLLAATASLVAIRSESRNESALADHCEALLRAEASLEVTRVGDNVVARREGRGPRVLLAGHLDTVPANGNQQPRVDGDVLWGLGAADMKGGLALMLRLAAEPEVTSRPLTFVFYAAEEVARSENGLLALAAARADLLEADVAILGEPTAALVEAGCQGVIKAQVRLGGKRAHTARPWMGINAAHRAAPVLAAIAGAESREPVVDGCTYREAVSVVAIEGGVAGNVVPDEVVMTVSHRFAPDRTAADAQRWLEDLVGRCLDPSLGDRIDILDVAPAAPPSLDHPVLAALTEASGGPPRAKLGWTDVAFFAERGVPAVNFGPGDPELAHTAGERVERSALDAAWRALCSALRSGPQS